MFNNKIKYLVIQNDLGLYKNKNNYELHFIFGEKENKNAVVKYSISQNNPEIQKILNKKIIKNKKNLAIFYLILQKFLLNVKLTN